MQTEVQIPPKFFSFTNIDFINNTFGNWGGIKIQRLANVTVRQLRNEDNHDNKFSPESTIEKVVFEAHKNYEDAYVTKGYSDGNVVEAC